jgi:hypothetical protein
VVGFLQGATCSQLRKHLHRKDDLIHIAPAVMPLPLVIGFEFRIFPASVKALGDSATWNHRALKRRREFRHPYKVGPMERQVPGGIEIK